MIEFVLGILVCFVFYGVFHLYPTKKDVKPKTKKNYMGVDSSLTFEDAHKKAVNGLEKYIKKRESEKSV